MPEHARARPSCPARSRCPSARRGAAGPAPGAGRWRRRRRRRRRGRRSPGARRPGSPLSVASPAASASATLGATPMPTTTQVGLDGRRRPRAVRRPGRPAFSIAGHLRRRVRRSTPCSRCRSAKTCATSGPSTRSSGRSSDSSTVTSAPAFRAAAAASRPIQPAPMIATGRPVGERLLEPLAVLDGAEVGDRRAASRRPSRGAAAATRWPAAACRRAAGRPRCAPRGRRCRCAVTALPEAQVDVVLVVPVRVVHERRLELVVAEQVALRQRRPLVGQVVLVAEHHDVPVEPRGRAAPRRPWRRRARAPTTTKVWLITTPGRLLRRGTASRCSLAAGAPAASRSPGAAWRGEPGQRRGRPPAGRSRAARRRSSRPRVTRLTMMPPSHAGDEVAAELRADGHDDARPRSPPTPTSSIAVWRGPGHEVVDPGARGTPPSR